MIRIFWIVLFATAAIAGETVREPELPPSYEKKLRAILRNTRFPTIDFVDATPRETLEFLVDKTKKIDERADIGMVLRLDADRPPQPVEANIPGQAGIPGLEGRIAFGSTHRITFRAKNVSVEKILDEICRQAKLRWRLGMHGIEITPARASPSHRHD